MSVLSFLDRERSVAEPGYSRWLVPPAALAIHLCIGQVYALSVFKLPLVEKFDTSETAIAIVFCIAIVMLGLSAAFGGTWMERNGPRKAMALSAACFSAGLLIGSLGIATEQLWLLYLGYGVVGGIGLGIGYISPVSTLIKWFPDRPGLATGMAIMGFGGGAFIASALSTELLQASTRDVAGRRSADRRARPDLRHPRPALPGLHDVRRLHHPRPPAGLEARGLRPARPGGNKMMTTAQRLGANAIRTPQFWLLWTVLFCNVTAGIGILEQASPMIQDFFPRLGGVLPAAAAGFVGLLSLFNMAGRFVWSSTSDVIGRKPTYMIYLGVGAVLFFLLATAGSPASCVFVLLAAAILSLLRRRLRDRPGLPQGPVRHLPGRRHPRPAAHRLVGRRRRRTADRQRHHREPEGGRRRGRRRLPAVAAGDGGLLVVGFVANLLVRPVAEKFQEPEEGGAGRSGTEMAGASRGEGNR